MSSKGEEAKSDRGTEIKEENKPRSETDSSSKKKTSPFLSSEMKSDVSDVETKSFANKQQDFADNILKEKSIFNAVGKLYFFSNKTSKLETRGEGEFYIFKDKAEMYRLMMIRDQFKLKGCNHYILPNCPLTRPTQTKNSWIWTALQDKSDAEKNEEKTLYFATFRDEDISKLFEEKYNQAKEENLKALELRKNTGKSKAKTNYITERENDEAVEAEK
ncbi:uncharacterized protein VICG_00728 [Vittaforma corneae ATCC 50505]|uniref:RanBD1 domain-containing protein n=1 Tax=Vittaforma corneae (strain ATCC 50505) TaxID=993615 RepID=L2GN53_VITCO|nr:uncharacterized protein VICG_00728 [Vittaforma corneae ATCC 50505]ELA42328.1 hypothetical protein VICG_00728 [Vittaforma corneae ATCC 50505]